MWRQDVLAGVLAPREMFGIESFSQAVPALLEKRDYQSAMLAARFGSALEDRPIGETLTDEVLRASHKSP
jgi:hypothetical protein